MSVTSLVRAAKLDASVAEAVTALYSNLVPPATGKER
jgi:hypothetical protein